MANKMADKKKNSSQRSTRNQSQALASKARSDEIAVAKARSNEMTKAKVRSDEKEQDKQVKAAAREKDERKAQESKPVRRESKGPPNWQVRLRRNRYFQFVLDAYYELRHKVTWPSFNEARNMTIAVILLSLAVGLVLFIADSGLNYLYNLLIHLGGR